MLFFFSRQYFKQFYFKKCRDNIIKFIAIDIKKKSNYFTEAKNFDFMNKNYFYIKNFANVTKKKKLLSLNIMYVST